MADANFFDLQDEQGNAVFGDLTPVPKTLKFIDDYDGLGNSRRLFTHNGTGAVTPYSGTVDYIVITASDPRYIDAADAPPVLALFENQTIVSGNKSLVQSNTSSGDIDSCETNQVVWFQVWNANGSYYALGTIKVMEA